MTASKVTQVLKGPAGWAIVIGVGGIVAWVLFKQLKKAGKEAAQQAAGLITGDNVITQNQHDWSGETVDAYQGKGVLGTLGAAANSASGGLFASWGETIAGWLSPGYDPNAKTATDADSKNFDQIQLNGW